MQLPPPGKNKQGFSSLGKFSCDQYLLVGPCPGWRSSTFWASKLGCSNSAGAETWLQHPGRAVSRGNYPIGASPSLLNHIVQRWNQVKGGIWAACEMRSQQKLWPKECVSVGSGELTLWVPTPAFHLFFFFSISCPNQLPVLQWLLWDHWEQITVWSQLANTFLRHPLGADFCPTTSEQRKVNCSFNFSIQFF